MNILIVSAMFPPIRTGTSFYTQNLANALAERKHNIMVVTVTKKMLDTEEEKFTVYRLPAIRIPIKNFLKHFSISSFFPQNYFKLHRITKTSSADVILLINHYLDIAFPAIFASRLNKIPLICSVGTQLQSYNKRRNKLLNILDRLICGNLVFPFCNRIVSWDTQVLQYLKDVQGQKIIGKSVIINYGAGGESSTFMSQIHDYSIHNQIICVGAITEQRNYIPLIKAFKIISNEFPDVHLKIVGHVYHDAAIRLTQQLGLSDRIVFTGELPHNEVFKELAQSDIYYVSLTSKYVGLGMATIESMQMGIPTIANVPPDLLGTAFLKDMDDIVLCNGIVADEIASKIRLLLASFSLRKKIGQQGRRFVIENMNWDKIAEKMEDLFTQVIGITKSPGHSR